MHSQLFFSKLGVISKYPSDPGCCVGVGGGVCQSVGGGRAVGGDSNHKLEHDTSDPPCFKVYL